MYNLFASEVNLQISRVSRNDALIKSDLLNLFKLSILKHEEMYPKILKWYNEKVVPGIIDGSRIAYLGFCNEIPVVTAVIKMGKSAKFCHLHTDISIQDRNIGELFFSMMVLDVRHIARDIHFTLPESLWDKEMHFFKSFGFDQIERSPIQYRKKEEELFCASSIDKVWDATLSKLPKILKTHSLDHESVLNGLLMSIQPKHINKILRGDKVIEIRKKFNHKWSNCHVTLYSTTPTKAVVGNAKIMSVVSDKPDKIWEDYGSELGCSKVEFKSYVGDVEKVFAIKLSNVSPYRSPIFLNQLSFFLNQNLTPPQSYARLKDNKNWINAISIAELLQGKFSTFVQDV